MKKLGIALAAAAALSLTACSAGPHQLRRSVDDWDQKMYIENPWLDGILWFIPVIPLATFGAQIGDFFIVDAYSFWVKDAWDGKGTSYKHFEPTATDGSMKSLLFDDAEFMKVE
jgi:hypothetical protein